MELREPGSCFYPLSFRSQAIEQILGKPDVIGLLFGRRHDYRALNVVGNGSAVQGVG